MIDVAAMDSHNLQPQEINNRLKVYSQKMAQQWNSIQDASVTPSGKKNVFYMSVLVFVNVYSYNCIVVDDPFILCI